MARKPESRPRRSAAVAREETGKTPRRKPRSTRAGVAKSTTKQPSARNAPRPRTRRVSRASAARDADALERLNRGYYDAFQSLELEQVSRYWWHDELATCIHPGWDLRLGWPAVSMSYAEIFAGTRSIRFALGDVRVRVNGDVAWVTCVENLVTEDTDSESASYLGAVLATNVFERRDGEWRLIHHHASPFAGEEMSLMEGMVH